MSSFARPQSAEEYMQTLNAAFQLGEERVAPELVEPTNTVPVAFIVGPPRSGTTVLSQWLAASGEFSYPTNLLARFPGAPYLGSLVQRLLLDPSLGYRDELTIARPENASFSSDLGKTFGVLGPHEFFYFWRRFFPVGLPSRLSPDEWSSGDHQGFADGLARLHAGLGRKPLAMKGIILQYNLADIAAILPHAVFLVTERDEVDNAVSLINARRRIGDEEAWFSVQPPGWESLLSRSPLDQVCGQVAWTNDDLAAQSAAIDAARVVHVPYDRFCAAPGDLWEELRTAMGNVGVDIGPARITEPFPASHAEHPEADDIRARLADVRRSRPTT